MNANSWQGVFPALITPFTKDDKIDLKQFETNVNAQVEAGVDGIVIGGSLGESSTLSAQEKKDLLIFGKELVGDNIPVVINIAEQSTKAAMEEVNSAQKYGADGLMVLPPMRYKADEREALEYFKTIAAATSLPIMVYNNPHDYKIEVTLHMFDELIGYDNIQAVKESTRDVTNVTRLKNRFGNRIKILCGVDTLALEELAAGADGWIAGLGNAFPRETVAIYRLMAAGYYKQALDIYRWFLPLLELDIHPKLVQYIKLAAMQTELGTEYVRAPRLLLEDNEKQHVLGIINKALSLRPELPEYLNLQPSDNLKWVK